MIPATLDNGQWQIGRPRRCLQVFIRLGQANDDVSITPRRHAIDDIDQAVLHAARGQGVDDVRDQRPAARRGCRPVHRCNSP